MTCHLLVRTAEAALNSRAQLPRVKEDVVRACEFLNVRLECKEIAEFEYQLKAANRPYRIVVLAKTSVEEKGQVTRGYRNRYFFYVTNDRKLSALDWGPGRSVPFTPLRRQRKKVSMIAHHRTNQRVSPHWRWRGMSGFKNRTMGFLWRCGTA